MDFKHLAWAVGFGAIGAVACGAAGDPVGQAGIEGAGTAQIAVTSTPSDVSCIRITAVGGTTKSTNFPVTAGQSTTLTMTGVPTGTVSFSGKAYGVACGSISGATPNYLSNTVTTTVSGTSPALVALSMTPNASAQVSVDFPSTATCGGTGAACDPVATPSTCCSGLGCTADAQSPTGGTCATAPTCGSAGAACVVATDCCAGYSCAIDPVTGKPTTCQATTPTCKPSGSTCVVATDCCSGNCLVGVCF